MEEKTNKVWENIKDGQILIKEIKEYERGKQNNSIL
jgi:hypothetical protein